MGPKWPKWAQSCPPKRNYSHEEKYVKGSKNGARKGPFGPFRAQIADCLISCR